MNPRPRVFVMGLALGLALWTGCDRAPRFVPAGADSTAARSPDSLAANVQQVRTRWESPDGEAEAAVFTARLVLDDLRLHPHESIASRVRTFMDSLTLGAEVIGRSEVAAANFFAPSDPGGGSWPYLFWRDGEEIRQQALEGGGMRLLDLLVQTPDPTASSATVAPSVAVLFARVAGAGQLPFVFVWRRAVGNAGWELGQSLGADSLGGVGTARFVAPSPDGVALITRTRVPTPRFDECATCPHVYRTRRFRWGSGGLTTAGEQIERSPYYTFVRFVQALTLSDRELADRLTADPSLVDAADGYQWGKSKGMWRLAPGTEMGSEHAVYFRGNQEAYRVHFAARAGDWVITGFEPTSRSIE